jgi:hypothetical protein
MFNEVVKKGSSMGTMSTQTQEDRKVHINMELEDDEEVGDEELISAPINIIMQLKSQFQLHGQVASQ